MRHFRGVGAGLGPRDVALHEIGGRLVPAGPDPGVELTLYESKSARDAVLKSPMESGVAAGYDRLDGILFSMK